MRYGFVNNFLQTLAVELAAGATTMTLDGGGSDLSNASEDLVYTLTLVEKDADGNEVGWEILHVTGADGNELTIERGQEGTSDQAWPVGTTVEMRLTAGVAGDFAQKNVESIEIGAEVEANFSDYPSGAKEGMVLVGDGIYRVESGNTVTAEAPTVLGWDAGFSDDSGYGLVLIGADSSAGGESEELVIIGTSASTGSEASNSVVLGASATVGSQSQDSVAIGQMAAVYYPGSTAIGKDATADGANSVTIGKSATSSGDTAISVGAGSEASADGAVGVGGSAQGQSSITLGSAGYAEGEGSQAFGMTAVIKTAYARVNHSLPVVQATPGEVPTDLEDDVPDGTTMLDLLAAEGIVIPSAATHNASQVVIATDPLDLTDDTAAVTLDLPANTILLIDAIDVVIVGSDGAGGSPEITVGPDDQAPADYLASTAVSKTSVGGRESHDPLISDGVTSLRVATAVAGSGTEYQAKVVFRGYVMEL